MNKTQSLEDFYKHKLKWMPSNLKKGLGHFNAFRMEEFAGNCAQHTPYSRKDYYKISLIRGRAKFYYADQTVDVKENALLFANPQIPYSWKHVNKTLEGCFCIFTETFFNQFGHLKDYPLFKPGTTPIFQLTNEEAEKFQLTFDKIFSELESDYEFKYDALRNLVYEITHAALKLQPAQSTNHKNNNAAVRVSSFFTELLERQFPIETAAQQVKLKSPVEFADQLSIHVNHLNRSLKEVTGKTTSTLIAERFIQESKILLAHTDWNIAEISTCMGFTEPPHFINFFKKHLGITPKSFRDSIIV